ncbi:MAG: TolC family protein, partial [Myxococcales bacterium]|nr:TolC family protein [Myxococcales bacterium]
MQKSAPSTLLSVLIGLCLLGTGGAALADDVDGAGTVILPAPVSPTVLAATGPSEMRLSLLEAIRMGIENNLQIEIQRHAPLIAYQEHEAAWGSYDPELFFDFTYANIEDPTANALATTSGESVSLNEFESYTGEGGFRGLIPWLGASYEMALTGDRALSNLSFQSLSPEFNSELLFSVTVPLLRGLIWNQPWTKLKTTQIQQRSSKDEFRRDVMDVVRRTENGYWALIADDERVRVAQKSLETRTALLDQVEIQYQVGVVSKVEIAEAAAGVASGEFDLILAQNRYQTSNDNLIDLVLGSRLRAESRIQLVPTDRPDDYVNYDIDPEQAAAIAFRYRPDLDIADRNIERLENNLK